MKFFKKTQKKFVFESANDALDKFNEVSEGSEYKFDIKPFEGIANGYKFMVIKEKNIWYLRICN